MFLFVLAAAAAVYALICLAFWIWQEKLLYWPGPPPAVTPAALGLEFRDLTITTRDGEKLHAWLVLPPHAGDAAPKGVFLVTHGNGGSIDLRLELAQSFAEMGFATLLFDYRGYGGSTGRPSEEGTYVDAEAVHDHLASVEGFPARTIVAFGESLGGAVAVELALRRPLAAVIVEDTFTSIPDVGAQVYPWLPVRLLGRSQYDSIGKVDKLTVPLLVIHSPEDQLVPFEHGRRLFAAAHEPKRFLSTAGPHSGGGFLLRDDWTRAVSEFARGAIGP